MRTSRRRAACLAAPSSARLLLQILVASALAASVATAAGDPPASAGTEPPREVSTQTRTSRPLGAPLQPAPVASQPARGEGAARRKKPEPPPPLDGATYDFALEPRDAGGSEKSWLGRVFVHRLAASASRPLPVLVFLHGINAELIRYRWMGGGQEGDVRRVVSELMESGRIPPVLVAAPSAIVPAATAVARTSWPHFDLTRFLDLTTARLGGMATLDRERVLVAGHSGGGCNASGGVVSAALVAPPVHAALVIDGCMEPDFASAIARAPATTHVIVSWQTQSWARRPFGAFERAFRREEATRPAAPGVLRELEPLRPTEPMPHDAMVPLVLRRWLPALLSPDALPDLPCVSP